MKLILGMSGCALVSVHRAQRRDYRENKIVAHLKNRAQEINPSPHHLQVIRGHKVGLAMKINSFTDKRKAVGMYNQTSCKRLLIQGNDHQMVQKPTRAISKSKAF